MKKLSFVVLTGAILFCSCGNGGNEKNKSNDSSATISNKEGEAMVNQPDTSAKSPSASVDEKCVEFAVKAANAGMKEIELGKWAKENATNADVKHFGSMMVEDHTKAADELKKIAREKHINLPSDVDKETREDIDKVKGKTGKDADKEYVDQMVKDHKDAVDLFEDASKKATDIDLKNFATKTLPTLMRHRDAIKAIKDKMK